MKAKIFLLLVFVASSIIPLQAQKKDVPGSWKEMVERPFPFENKSQFADEREAYYLVGLKEGVRQSELPGSTFPVFRDLGNGWFIVKAYPEAFLQQASFLEGVWEVNNQWKLSPTVKARPSGKEAIFTIRSTAPATSLARLSAVPALTIVDAKAHIIRIRCSYETLQQQVLVLKEVIYAGIESSTPKTESKVLDLNLHPNSINRIHHEFPALNGQGITISIQEPRYDPEDIDLRGRDIPSTLSASEISRHTTDMATIAAGAGNSFVSGRGVAWAANITSSDFQDVLPDADADYQALDAWVQNHSYGTLIENFYGSLAEAFDVSARNNVQLLHVFSSGNQGTAAGTGPYEGISGYANLTGNFKMSKNTLVIGSVDTLGRPLYFSSKGPAYDGRIKPELTAYSTEGSSNSAALVSGTVALLQQAYKEQKGVIPPSALLKAVLINSARDAGPKGIDFSTGFGSVNGYRSLQNLRSGNYFSGSVGQGETLDFSLDLPVNSKNLKITIVWNDPAALPNAATALVNDLDMVLRASDGTSWLPWLLDSRPGSGLSDPAKRGVDHLNNVEQISLENPAPGSYTISVKGYELPEGMQDFYIAYQWETENTFSWSSPSGSDNMPYDGETTGYFRWDSSFEGVSGRLEYSIDGENSWELIAAGLDLAKGAYRWKAPQVNAVARARMLIDGDTFLTEPFVISRPPVVSIGFQCADSMLVQWKKMDQATHYRLYGLGEFFLKPLATTADTQMVVDKNWLGSRYFAVEPVLKGDAPAIRSLTYDYALQGNSCFLNSFFSEVSGREGINLLVQLGTTYTVHQLVFEREEKGVFTPIGTLAVGSADSSSFSFLDEQPKEGLNTYRVLIELEDGTRLVSASDRNYFLTNPPFLVFPNPVSGSGKLMIFSEYDEEKKFVFRLYNSRAQLITQKRFRSDREYLPLKGLAAGLYFYVIELEDRLFQGRVLIE